MSRAHILVAVLDSVDGRGAPRSLSSPFQSSRDISESASA